MTNPLPACEWLARIASQLPQETGERFFAEADRMGEWSGRMNQVSGFVYRPSDPGNLAHAARFQARAIAFALHRVRHGYSQRACIAFDNTTKRYCDPGFR